jgi:hypothetical protein
MYMLVRVVLIMEKGNGRKPNVLKQNLMFEVGSCNDLSLCTGRCWLCGNWKLRTIDAIS